MILLIAQKLLSQFLSGFKSSIHSGAVVVGLVKRRNVMVRLRKIPD